MQENRKLRSDGFTLRCYRLCDRQLGRHRNTAGERASQAPLFAVEPTTAGTPASNKGKLTAGSGSSPDAADRNVWIVA
jgi:hypothetical protein